MNMSTLSLGSVRNTTFAYVGAGSPPSPTTKLASATTNGNQTLVSYDPAGNETAYVGTRTYSPRNLLASVTVPGAPQQVNTYSYAYDGFGVRTSTATHIGGVPDNPGSKFSFYSPEFNLLSEATCPLNDTAPPAATTEYIWFNGQLVAQENLGASPTTRFTFLDHLGTPLLQTDLSGTVVWRVEHEPFGNVFSYRVGSSSDYQPIRFPGQELTPYAEDSTEQSYNIFRWYRAGWGRYTQADPIGMTGGTNLFAYVEGRPSNSTDPTGLFTVDGSCLCGGSFNRNTFRATAAGARSVCNFFAPGFAARNPKCRDALRKIVSYSNSYGVTPLSCMYRACQNFTIKCVKGQGNCGGPPSNLAWEPGVIFIQSDQFQPHSGCGSVGNTIFHESLHLCGVPTESVSGNLAQEISTECYGD